MWLIIWEYLFLLLKIYYFNLPGVDEDVWTLVLEFITFLLFLLHILDINRVLKLKYVWMSVSVSDQDQIFFCLGFSAALLSHDVVVSPSIVSEKTS